MSEEKRRSRKVDAATPEERLQMKERLNAAIAMVVAKRKAERSGAPGATAEPVAPPDASPAGGETSDGPEEDDDA